MRSARWRPRRRVLRRRLAAVDTRARSVGGRRIARRQGDGERSHVPGARVGGTPVRGQRLRLRRRRVDADGHTSRGTDVAGVVEGAVVVGVHAVAGVARRSRHGELIAHVGVGPDAAALHRVLGLLHAGAAGVAGTEGHQHVAVVPAGGIGRRRRGRRGDRRRRGVDIDVADVMGSLRVTGVVGRPEGDHVAARCADGERAAVREPLLCAVDGVVDMREAGPSAGVAGRQAHHLRRVLPSGGRRGLQGATTAGRRGRVDLDLDVVDLAPVVGPVRAPSRGSSARRRPHP